MVLPDRADVHTRARARAEVQSLRAFERLRAAHHEAAHAVVAYRMGVPILSVRVRMDGSGFVLIPGLSLWNRWAIACVAMAGVLGEEAFCRKVVGWCDEAGALVDDAQTMLRDLLAGRTAGSASDRLMLAEALRAAPGATIRAARARAARILRGQRRALERLSARLADGRRMTGTDVGSLLARQWHGPKPANSPAATVEASEDRT